MIGYRTGQYRIALLDRLGHPLRTLTADSYAESRDIGDTYRAAAECHAYAISRVLFDSRDQHYERYDVRPR